MRICIFGASGRELDERYYAEAETLGELIGSRKACRAGAYDQDFFACLLFGFDELVAVF